MVRTHMFVSILVTAPFAAFHALADRPPGELARCVSAVAEDAGLSGSVTISLSGTPLVDLYRGRQAGPGSKLIDSQTRFNIGSVSKMFTSVAVGQLVDRGKLRLDEPIGDIVGGLSSATSRVTVRQLLNHTAGTGDFFRPENMETMRRARTAADILPLIVHENPAFKPGTRFLYSNSGFALLGVAIERVAGMRYGEYLKRYVFDPAGMTSTGLDPHPLATLAVAMTKVELQEGDFSGAVHRRTVSGGPGTPGGMAPPATPGGRLLLIGHDNGPSPALSMRSGELRQAPGATEGYGSPAGGLYSTGADLARFRLRTCQWQAAFEIDACPVHLAPGGGGRGHCRAPCTLLRLWVWVDRRGGNALGRAQRRDVGRQCRVLFRTAGRMVRLRSVEPRSPGCDESHAPDSPALGGGGKGGNLPECSRNRGLYDQKSWIILKRHDARTLRRPILTPSMSGDFQPGEEAGQGRLTRVRHALRQGLSLPGGAPRPCCSRHTTTMTTVLRARIGCLKG